MQMQVFSVGQKVCTPDGSDNMVFDITESGALLIVKMNHPTANEKREFKKPATSIKFVEVNGIIFILARFGTLNWMDAPYHRMFSFGEIHFSPLGPTEGLATTIMLVDSSDGTLVAQKLYGMDHDVSVRLIDAIEHQHPMPNYDEVLQRTFAMYRTTDLVKMAQQE